MQLPPSRACSPPRPPHLARHLLPLVTQRVPFIQVVNKGVRIQTTREVVTEKYTPSDPSKASAVLADAYEQCKKITAVFAKTFYLVRRVRVPRVMSGMHVRSSTACFAAADGCMAPLAGARRATLSRCSTPRAGPRLLALALAPPPFPAAAHPPPSLKPHAAHPRAPS